MLLPHKHRLLERTLSAVPCVWSPFQGWIFSRPSLTPRALPWAIVGCPFGSLLSENPLPLLPLPRRLLRTAHPRRVRLPVQACMTVPLDLLVNILLGLLRGHAHRLRAPAV